MVIKFIQPCSDIPSPHRSAKHQFNYFDIATKMFSCLELYSGFVLSFPFSYYSSLNDAPHYRKPFHSFTSASLSDICVVVFPQQFKLVNLTFRIYFTKQRLASRLLWKASPIQNPFTLYPRYASHSPKKSWWLGFGMWVRTKRVM